MPMPPRIPWARALSWVCRSEPVTDAPHPDGIILHATCVAHSGRAVLIRGASGRGKSGLALQLLALGAGLVADDRTRLWLEAGRIMADAPETIRGQIEARGMGILQIPSTGPQPLALIVDLDTESTDRLPPLEHADLLGQSLPLVKKADHAHFPAAVLLYLMHGTLI
ncbi:HPr kinase/phosphorylase [Roseovarius sp. EC-HK134]|nr:HPr kinase/phosphorylase [Roseovarius sp. EC-SD190]VVT20963.1 HPr kinase/phosphorylase [Roseovarius sp. EC-HK134]